VNPLARLRSLKLKLGIVIVLAILVTLFTMLVAAKLGLRLRWGALVALAVSLVSVQIVARGMTSPLRAMARAAEAMARGEHGQRVQTTSRDEVGQLAAAFNTMAAEVAKLDRARSEFVADAAHELRTPITALRATLENAVDGVEEPNLPELLAQVERLGHLADQLLDLSALEAGQARLERTSFAVAELADGCEAILEVPNDLYVSGDPARLRQVVRNLVENAHRHAPGTRVVVRAAAQSAGGVRLEVEDGGAGLDESEAARVFDRFARGDRSRAGPGSGLGLSIARSIVELHGGAIRAERATPHGCRMVVELP
jgi:signal transduction histidine kinase